MEILFVHAADLRPQCAIAPQPRRQACRVQRAGVTSTERDRLKELERENRELKRANEILRKASAFFAQAELDRRPK